MCPVQSRQRHVPSHIARSVVEEKIIIRCNWKGKHGGGLRRIWGRRSEKIGRVGSEGGWGRVSGED